MPGPNNCRVSDPDEDIIGGNEEHDFDPQDDEPEENDVDLDQFLQLNEDQLDTTATQKRSLILPDMDKIVVVGIFLDDSGSMDGLESAVREGLKLAIEGFNGARGSDFYLDVRGFKGQYFQGMIKEVKESAFDGYYGSYRCTPLVEHASEQLRDLKSLAKRYRDMGIPATVAQLLMTDGQPYEDRHSPEYFKRMIECGDYIVGMGIVKGGEESISEYKELFHNMGITNTLTPKSQPAEVRHAINQFSQSVASISTVAA